MAEGDGKRFASSRTTSSKIRIETAIRADGVLAALLSSRTTSSKIRIETRDCEHLLLVRQRFQNYFQQNKD